MREPHSEEAIARGVAEHGAYRFAVNEPDEQCVVDIRWAALKAGRLLGVRLQVQMSFEEPLRVHVVISGAPRSDE